MTDRRNLGLTVKPGDKIEIEGHSPESRMTIYFKKFKGRAIAITVNAENTVSVELYKEALFSDEWDEDGG